MSKMVYVSVKFIGSTRVHSVLRRSGSCAFGNGTLRRTNFRSYFNGDGSCPATWRGGTRRAQRVWGGMETLGEAVTANELDLDLLQYGNWIPDHTVNGFTETRGGSGAVCWQWAVRKWPGLGRATEEQIGLEGRRGEGGKNCWRTKCKVWKEW